MLQKMFGKKRELASPAAAGDVVSRTLSMDRVREYAIALVSKRGFPADSHQMIAERVVFLERRGLPGLLALLHEFATAKQDFAQRTAQSRQMAGGHCPIVAGVELNAVAEQLTTAEDGDAKWIVAPSNPILLIPKIAEWVRPTGRLVRVSWAIDRQVVAETVIDGFRIAHIGPLSPLQHSEHIGFCRFPEESVPVPKLTAGFLDEATYPGSTCDNIDLYLVRSR